MSWILAFAGFAALIILHEAGHMIAAKAVGMRVERFFLFFPPKLWSFTRGETEYGIGVIPLGGFVKITGMNPDEELEPEIAARGYYHQPVWKRIVVIGAGPFVNVLIAFVILFALGFTIDEPTKLTIQAIEKDSPAEDVVRPGDRIEAINGVSRGEGTEQEQSERITGALGSLECPGEQEDGCTATESVPVTVVRDGEQVTLQMQPFYDSEAERFRFGFSFAGGGYVDPDDSIQNSADFAVTQMWEVTSRTLTIVARIFDAEQRKQLSGVVGSYEVTRQSIEFDTRQALFVLALISLSLAVINLFPFLPLDGGHIFWSVVEKVRGRPVAFKTMERASVVGFALVMVLFVIGLSNDIGRLTGEGFDVGP